MNHPILSLTSDFFSELRIPGSIILIDQPLKEGFDLGLRKTLFQMETEADYPCPKDLSAELPELLMDHHICILRDIYRCSYIFIPIPEQEFPSALLLGPYLEEAANLHRLQRMCSTFQIPTHFLSYLIKYYSNLACYENFTIIESYISVIRPHLYKETGGDIRHIHLERGADLVYRDTLDEASEQKENEKIEKRYRMENDMLDAISNGDTQKALQISDSGIFHSLDKRNPDTLRSQKNYMIILNTLCRKAAERGHIHPVYLDDISRTIAIRIEALASVSQIQGFARDMVRKYCFLVQQKNTAGYSALMQQVLNYISLHYTAPELTLNEISQHFSLNKSYLSSLFKKETNQTLTAYINSLRIEHAIFLLNTQDDSIQNIASSCGIPDVTYFTRLFRREKDMTPSEYRKMLKAKNN